MTHSAKLLLWLSVFLVVLLTGEFAFYRFQAPLLIPIDKTFTKPTTSNCLISSYGKDGIGHQIEAKLSCIITAISLNLTYIHQPVDKLDHGENPDKMESLFGFSRSIDRLAHFTAHFNSNIMETKLRTPLPYIGNCDKPSWFDNYLNFCRIENKKIKKKNTVFTNDNCWDHFWCQNETLPFQWWNTTLPTLHQNFFHKELPAQPYMNSNHVSVAVHMRLGDSGDRRSNGGWVNLVLNNLWDTATINNVKLTISIFSDGKISEVKKLLQVDHTNQHLPLNIYGQDATKSLEQSLQEMVTSDIFISSDSSLSHSVCFLKTPNSIIIHPESLVRSRMVLFGWKVLRMPKDTNGTMELCVEPNQFSDNKDGKWKSTDRNFWSSVVALKK